MIKYSTGLRDHLQGLQATVVGAVVGAGLAFVDGGESADTITDAANGFVTAKFAPNMKLFVQGASTAGNNTQITGVRLTSVAVGTLTIPTGSVANAEAGAVGTVVAVAKGGSLKDILMDGVIRVYTGAQPDEADDSIGTATLLLTLTVSAGAFVAGAFGNGLEFEDDPLSGEIEKRSTETWQGVAVASGSPGWFRFYANATDAGGESTVLPRVDGTVGSAGDMILGTTIVSGRTYTLDSFKLTLPAYYGASS